MKKLKRISILVVVLLALSIFLSISAEAKQFNEAETTSLKDLTQNKKVKRKNISSTIKDELKEEVDSKIVKKVEEEERRILEEEQRRKEEEHIRRLEELMSGSEMVPKDDFAYVYENAPAYAYEELFSIARELYGMDEVTFNLSLGWFAGDNLEGQDDYWSYLSACVPINYINRAGQDSFKKNYLEAAWAKSTSYYSYDSYSSRARNANEYIRKIFYIAMTHLDPNPIEADGVCVENGYKVSRTTADAYYQTNARWFHVLPTGSYEGVAGVWS